MALRVGHARWKLRFCALLSLLFVSIGFWMVWRGPFLSEDWWRGVIGAAFFGLCFWIFAIRLITSGPAMVVDLNGFFDSRAMDCAIPWNAIKSISEGRLIGAHYFSLRLTQPAADFIKSPTKRMLGLVNKPFIGGDVFVPLQLLDTDIRDIRAAIGHYKTLE